MNIDKRLALNILSVTSLEILLRDILVNPKNYLSDEVLQNALHSQGALSRYSDEARSISPSSINTLKRISDRTIQGGFLSIDSLRIRAAKVLENEKPQPVNHRKNTRAHLIAKIKDLQVENQTIKQDLHQLTYVFHKSLKYGAAYAKESDKPELLDICRKDQKQLLLSLSLIQTPLECSVVNINEK